MQKEIDEEILLMENKTAILLRRIFYFSCLISPILFYIVIWHFEKISNVFNIQLLHRCMPDLFVVKLIPYEKGVLLGFVLLVLVILYSIVTFIITIRGLILFKDDIYIKPLLINLRRSKIKSEKRKKPYNEDGLFYKLFIQPDSVSPFIAKQSTDTPLSRFLFGVLFIFFCFFEIWLLSHGFFLEKGGASKIKQFVFCIFIPFSFSGMVSLLTISFYRSFNKN
ncbi:MAG: hypothetical protein J6V99_00245 [Neisseriaceae bacterium]|nr:hypothetical protein [Neisseriaceae bacterium]